MQKSGARNLRLVIGKRRAHQSNDTRVAGLGDGEGALLSWIRLSTGQPIANQIGERSYIPLYAYAGSNKYRATATSVLLAGN